MTQGELEKIPQEIVRTMSQLQIRIMEDMVRRIRINGFSTASADWQFTRLQQLGMSEKQIKDWVREALDVSEKEIEKIYSDDTYQEYMKHKRAYDAYGRSRIPFEENAELRQLIEAVTRQTMEELENITRTMGIVHSGSSGSVQPMTLTEYYRKTLDDAMYDIQSGAFDYNTVLKRTVEDMTTSGIRWIDYDSGRHNRIPVASRRAVMTGFRQVQGKINEQTARDLGTDSYEVTVHIGARPTHQVWEGKVWTMEQLQSVCGLGTVTGLHGANCYHDYNAFVPGVSVRTYTDDQLDQIHQEENTPKTYNGKEYTTYEALQRQRKLETRARKYREDVHLLEKGGGSEDDIIAKKCQYQKTLQEYRAFSNKMDLPMQKERIYQDGLKVDMKALRKKKVEVTQKPVIISSGESGMNRQIHNIEQRNSARGKPVAVAHFGVDLSPRQIRILGHLSGYDSEYIAKKKDVSMADLAALTAETGDEFALFTRKGERLIIRGDSLSVNVTYEKALELRKMGYKWSGHTHPGNDDFVLFPSDGDKEILKVFEQEQSVIYNSVGKFYVFEGGE